MKDFVPTSAETIIVEAQRILARYLPPDSTMTAEQCISELLAVLDGPEAVEIFENVEARRKGGYRAQPHGGTTH
jgi:hypothetical protein